MKVPLDLKELNLTDIQGTFFDYIFRNNATPILRGLYSLCPYIGLIRNQGFIKNPRGFDSLMGDASADKQIHSPF